jgi:hypothetical protein
MAGEFFTFLMGRFLKELGNREKSMVLDNSKLKDK